MSSKIEKGDMVEVVHSHSGTEYHPPIERWDKYCVKNLFTCSCGRVYLDIGLKFMKSGFIGARCGHCNAAHYSSSLPNPHYDQILFRKIEPSYKLVEIETSVREELKKFNVTEKIDA